MRYLSAGDIQLPTKVKESMQMQVISTDTSSQPLVIVWPFWVIFYDWNLVVLNGSWHGPVWTMGMCIRKILVLIVIP